MRALLAGYRCVTVPKSVVYHKYQLKMGPAKFYYIERNRWVVMLRNYRLGTVLLLLPGLLAIEALVWIGAAKLGRRHLLAKTRSYGGVARMIPAIRRGRREARELRRISDREVLDRLQGPLPIGLLVPRQRTANGGDANGTDQNADHRDSPSLHARLPPRSDASVAVVGTTIHRAPVATQRQDTRGRSSVALRGGDGDGER